MTNTCVPVLAINDTGIFAGPGAMVFSFTNNGISWTAVNKDLPYMWISKFALCGKKLFAGTATYHGSAGGGVFLSTNNGAELEGS